MFPRFQPGCRAETKLEAEIALKVPLQTAPFEVADAVWAVVFVVVVKVVAAVVVVALVVVTAVAVVATPVVVPGRH